MADKLTTSLQESVLTLLCMNEDEGAIAAGLVDLELFEPPYDDIAARALAYRAKYGKPPGNAHLDDLFDHILADHKNKRHKLYQQVLGNILEQADGLNAPYVLSRVNEFTDAQNLKAAIIEAGQKYQAGIEPDVAEVKNILHKAITLRAEPMDSGTFLSDKKRILGFINPDSNPAYALGIPELDRRGLGPTPGEALGFMAPMKRGKTWFCIHAGTMGIMQNANVLHISLEMGDERIMPRYLQRLMAIAKRKEEFEITRFELDKLKRISGFIRESQRPELAFSDPDIQKKIGRKMDQWGDRLGRKLVVKSFPTSTLTMGQLEAYMNGLEATHGFIPNMLILDYPKLTKLDDRQDLRIALGRRMEELRGICVKRNLAGIFPFQSNREGEGAKLITSAHTGEDYSLGQTVDLLITYNQTKMEKELGLARLLVAAGRNEEDGFQVAITQNYRTGQFVMQSAYLPTDYWKYTKKASGQEEDD